MDRFHVPAARFNHPVATINDPVSKSVLTASHVVVARCKDNNQISIFQLVIMSDPMPIKLVCEQDSDANLPDAGQDGQGVDISPGPVCVEVQQVGVEGEWTREPLVSSILGRDSTCLLLLC